MPQRGPRACHFGSFWRLLLFLWDPTSTQHTKRGTKSVWTGQVHVGLEQLWGSGSCHSEGPKNSPTGLLCLQQTSAEYTKNWPQGYHYTFISEIHWTASLQFHFHEVTFPWAHATLDIPVFVEKLPPTLGEVPSLLNLLSQKTLTASLVYAQNPWWDPWWKRSQSSSCYEPECECDKRNGTFGVQNERFKQWNEKLRRIHSVSLHSVPVQVVGTP